MFDYGNRYDGVHGMETIIFKYSGDMVSYRVYN